jgi:ubiquinone/menaquinone biosynthesis C-methylase UbiE
LQGNAAALSFDAATFDLILFFTVFSSVLDDSLRQDMAAEALRVLKPGGAIVWYDLRLPNPGNKEVRPLSRKAIGTLFPTLTPHLQATTLLPPLARRLGRATGKLYPVLSRIGWLRTHYVGLLM